jgi:hypothetical protein
VLARHTIGRYSLLLICLISTYARPSTGPWLHTLFEAQAKDNAACSAPLSELKTIQARVREGVDPMHSYFNTKADALKAIQSLAKYPGRSQATSVILGHIETDRTVPISQRVSAVLKVQSCNDLGYFKAFRHLIASAPHFKFSEAECRSTRDIVENFVQDHLDRPINLISLVVRISLIDQLLESGLLTLDKERLAQFRALQAQSKSTTDTFAENSRSWPDALNANNAGQFPESTLRSVLNGVLIEMKQVSAIQKQLKRTLQSKGS